ncbi:MAG: MBL fold metallo-hydrolase [Desulfuromonadales bacterium]|nr:MBL fold metallo-hydrolase [Desulfuromonadales bacterium]MDW7757663.1 MBL fold metallo-hydrolase [Desulfuromonadales bacterium]
MMPADEPVFAPVTEPPVEESLRKHTVNTPYMVGEVHFYATELQGEPVLFDTGPPTEEGRQALCRSVDLSRLRHVFITHCHVDHYGLAGFIAENSDAVIYVPRLDALKMRHHEQRLTFMEDELRQLGFAPGFVDAFRRGLERSELFPRLPKRMEIVEESDVPAQLGIGVLAAPGHCQSDLVYQVNGCAVTGDILLRHIFQAPLLDFDLQTLQGRFPNYRAYCDSLTKLQALRGLRIRPGHRDYVAGLEETILFYVNKLVQRAAKVATFPVELPVARVLERMLPVPAPDPFIAYLKASEVVFMRDYLAEPWRLREALAALGLLDRLSQGQGSSTNKGEDL